MTPAIEIHDLNFRYAAAKPVLRGVSFSLEDGFSVILGANGAGKSTLMGLMAGEHRPPPGTVVVGGTDVRDSSAWKRSVGWVPQRNVFDPGDRVLAFVTDVGWLRGLSRAEARSAAGEALELVGLSDRKRSRLRTLSGGMKWQAMVAAGIVHSPDVLLLDEPTAGLGPNHRAFLTGVLRRMADRGISVLMSTHVAADVEDAERVLVLDGGRIVADSPVADLLAVHGSVDAAFRAVTAGGGAL
ncbi:ABC transporter ATP-binding protein [Corynebacterium bovis]|uniref:ABC transporter ATP-binding protein n=1 Tax=Corynebacterium bovis TaxID=36808 RepID=UPI003139F746